MKRSWMMIAVGLLVAMLAIGAVACDDDEDNGGGDGDPTATAQMDDGAPTEPAGEPTEPAGEPTEPADDAGATIDTAENAEFGSILTDAEGNTLYVFANDEPGVSNCVDACLDVWPALTTDGEPTAGASLTGEIGTIEREDGTVQVTYDGAALYYFANDTAPGDTNGHGVADLWSVVEVG